MKFMEITSEIAKLEGKRHQASVGDVREVVKLTLSLLANMPFADIANLLAKYRR